LATTKSRGHLAGDKTIGCFPTQPSLTSCAIRRCGLSHRRTGKRFTALANNELKESSDGHRAFKGIIPRPAGRLPRQVHLSSPALAAGLCLFLDFSRRSHAVGIDKHHPRQGCCQRRGNAIDSRQKTHEPHQRKISSQSVPCLRWGQVLLPFFGFRLPGGGCTIVDGVSQSAAERMMSWPIYSADYFLGSNAEKCSQAVREIKQAPPGFTF